MRAGKLSNEDQVKDAGIQPKLTLHRDRNPQKEKSMWVDLALDKLYDALDDPVEHLHIFDSSESEDLSAPQRFGLAKLDTMMRGGLLQTNASNWFEDPVGVTVVGIKYMLRCPMQIVPPAAFLVGRQSVNMEAHLGMNRHPNRLELLGDGL